MSLRVSLIPIHAHVYFANPSSEEIRVVSGGPLYVFTPDVRGWQNGHGGKETRLILTP